MSDTVNTESEIVAEVDIAGQIIKDKEIRKLPAGSEEFKAAVEKLTEKKASESTAEANDETRKKSKSGLEKRFSELTSARDAEKQRADELERRLSEIEQANSKSPENISVQTEDFHIKRPEVSHFKTYDEYMEALADWKIEKREFDKEQKVYVEEVKKKHVETLSSWETREKLTKERVEGYDQLVDQSFIQELSGIDSQGRKSKNGIASAEAMTFLLESDAGPDLLFELAEDEEKLNKFKEMSSVRQVAFLSKLEMNYEKEIEKNSAKVSKAPSPSKALPRGKTVPAKSIDPRNGPLSFADYQEWRKSQKK
jgi:hypothetical protein